MLGLLSDFPIFEHFVCCNSQAHSHIKLNDGVNDMTPVTFVK